MRTPENVRQFYKSTAWRKCSKLKRLMAHGICEECGRAGWEVHHIIPLTAENVNDPNISINLDNLQLLCTSCHDAKRGNEEKEIRRDLQFDEDGNLIKR